MSNSKIQTFRGKYLITTFEGPYGKNKGSDWEEGLAEIKSSPPELKIESVKRLEKKILYIISCGINNT